MMVISHHKVRRQRQRSRSRDRVHPHAQAPQAPQVPQIQPMVIQEPVTVPDEYPAVVSPSSPSAGPSPAFEQRGRSRRQQRSRPRELAPPHVPPHAGQQPQPVAPPPGWQMIQPLATQGADGESATVEPQSRASDRSRSPQRENNLQERSPQKQKGKKTMADVKEPSGLPQAKKHKPMESDEDDEEPPNEPGTASNAQPIVPVLPLHPDLHVLTSCQFTRTFGQHQLTLRMTNDYTDDRDEYGKAEMENRGPAIPSARSHDSQTDEQCDRTMGVHHQE